MTCTIFQSNFLGGFGSLNPKKSKKAKSRQVVMETLWLELLLNLSFSMEGQQMILKISGRKTLVESANVGGGGYFFCADPIGIRLCGFRKHPHSFCFHALSSEPVDGFDQTCIDILLGGRKELI